jgi:REP element-mobilizing transposase RayT
MYDPQKQHRQSHRLRGYDYSLSAPYFVTICSQNAVSLFGEVEDKRMLLNQQGGMVEGWLMRIQTKFPGVLLDSFQVMPNHLHMILVIMEGGLDMAAKFGIGVDPEFADESDKLLPSAMDKQKGSPVAHPTLGRTVQWFKTMTTNNYIREVRQSGWKPFSKRLWQRDYFDHIIRNEVTLERTRDYMRNNPMYWSVERQRPDRMGEQSFEEWLLENEM